MSAAGRMLPGRDRAMEGSPAAFTLSEDRVPAADRLARWRWQDGTHFDSGDGWRRVRDGNRAAGLSLCDTRLPCSS